MSGSWGPLSQGPVKQNRCLPPLEGPVLGQTAPSCAANQTHAPVLSSLLPLGRWWRGPHTAVMSPALCAACGTLFLPCPGWCAGVCSPQPHGVYCWAAPCPAHEPSISLPYIDRSAAHGIAPASELHVLRSPPAPQAMALFRNQVSAGVMTWLG